MTNYVLFLLGIVLKVQLVNYMIKQSHLRVSLSMVRDHNKDKFRRYIIQFGKLYQSTSSISTCEGLHNYWTPDIMDAIRPYQFSKHVVIRSLSFHDLKGYFKAFFFTNISEL